MRPYIIITCEHGGNWVPKQWQYLLADHPGVLKTHRAIDWGSETLFIHFTENADYSAINHVTRLLIELNRSLHHPKLFSEFSKKLSKEEKDNLIKTYYEPYRNDVENTIERKIKDGRDVIHISIHTFTPKLNNVERNFDIGFLYDPSRKIETEWAQKWKKTLKNALPDFKVRMNRPYKGVSDGFTTFLRNIFTTNYAGIELEVNQKWYFKGSELWESLSGKISQSFYELFS